MNQSMSSMWTRQKTCQLINLYHENECLWKNTSPLYRHKAKRTEALKYIADSLSTPSLPLTTDDIKSKINGIRTQFIKELHRVMVAEDTGNEYSPALWFFSQMSFLRPFTQPKNKSVKQHIGSWTNYMVISKTETIEDEPNNSPSESTKQRNSNIKIKPESFEEVMLIDDDFDEDVNSSYIVEDRKETSNILSPSVIDSGQFTDESEDKRTFSPRSESDDNERVKKTMPSPCSSSEITIIRTEKRKPEENSQALDKKIKKCDDRLPAEISKKEEDRTDIFCKFIASQMRTVTDKVLLMKLEHAIQNAVIEYQIKQSELEASKNE